VNPPAVTAAAHPAADAPSRHAAPVTTPPDGTIGTNGTTNVAMTETTNAGIVTMIVATETMTAVNVIASAPVTVPALLTTGTVISRTTVKGVTTTAKDATMTESAVMTSVSLSRMAKTGKVYDLVRMARDSYLQRTVPLDPVPSAHDELDTAE